MRVGVVGRSGRGKGIVVLVSTWKERTKSFPSVYSRMGRGKGCNGGGGHQGDS